MTDGTHVGCPVYHIFGFDPFAAAGPNDRGSDWMSFRPAIAGLSIPGGNYGLQPERVKDLAEGALIASLMQSDKTWLR